MFLFLFFPQVTTGLSTCSTKALPRRSDPTGSRVFMTGRETLLCHCVCGVQEKREVDCFLCLQWTYTLLICKRWKCNDVMENRATNLDHCDCLRLIRHLVLNSCVTLNVQFFQNTIGSFDCKIKVFEYETTNLELSSFRYSVLTCSGSPSYFQQPHFNSCVVQKHDMSQRKTTTGNSPCTPSSSSNVIEANVWNSWSKMQLYLSH